MQLPLEKIVLDLKEVVDKVIQKLKDEGTYQSYLEKAATLTEVEQSRKKQGWKLVSKLFQFCF